MDFQRLKLRTEVVEVEANLYAEEVKPKRIENELELLQQRRGGDLEKFRQDRLLAEDTLRLERKKFENELERIKSLHQTEMDDMERRMDDMERRHLRQIEAIRESAEQGVEAVKKGIVGGDFFCADIPRNPRHRTSHISMKRPNRPAFPQPEVFGAITIPLR